VRIKKNTIFFFQAFLFFDLVFLKNKNFFKLSFFGLVFKRPKKFFISIFFFSNFFRFGFFFKPEFLKKKFSYDFLKKTKPNNGKVETERKKILL
jgi:hypothetical protein